MKLEQFTQRGDRCLVPRNIQGHVGWCPKQPDPVKDVPTHCSGCWA